MNLRNKLSDREKKGRPILLGLVGCGQMGTDIINQTLLMDGIKVAVAADTDVENAKEAYEMSGFSSKKISREGSAGKIQLALEKGKRVITENSNLLPQVNCLDVIIDATGVPEVGAELGLESINNGKHIVMMNVEADVCVGPILKNLADSAGVVYTGAAGDEPAAIMELYDFACSLGYEIVAAGKGKNNPLRPSATPDDLKDEAEERGMSAKMLTSFVEGSKTMVEMAAVSNATGLEIDVRGMHGPEANLDELVDIFSAGEKGGILNNTGVVDYSLGNVAPGVFVIVTMDNERVKFCLDYSKMGSGPNYLLYRPYHLVSLETPLTAARAVMMEEADIAPEAGLVTEVITEAKKDLKPGDKIDGMGGYTVRGSVAKADRARKENLLPLGLCSGAIVRKEINQGQIITTDMVEVDKDSIIYQLRALQEKLLD